MLDNTPCAEKKLIQSEYQSTTKVGDIAYQTYEKIPLPNWLRNILRWIRYLLVSIIWGPHLKKSLPTPPPQKKNIFNHKNCSNNQSFSNIRPVQSKEIGRKLFLALNLRSFRAGGAEPRRSQNSKVVGILVFWYHRRVGSRGLYLWCSLFFFPTQCLENS